MVYIIIVDYNGYMDTIECLKSIALLTTDNYKVIVVDNGSVDGSVEKIKSLGMPNLIVIESEVNLGFSGGNNLGIKYAVSEGAEYILLLNNDTLVEPNFLEVLVSTEKEYQNKVVLTSKIKYVSDPKRIWCAGGRFNVYTGRTENIGIGEIDSGQYDKRTDVNLISGCCMFIPATIIEEVGLLEEKYFMYCEDLDYCCRLIEHNIRMIYEPNAVIYHKVGGSASKITDLTTYYSTRNMHYIIRKFVPRKFKCLAEIYYSAECIKRIIFGRYSLHAVLAGRKDFNMGIDGKKNFEKI